MKPETTPPIVGGMFGLPEITIKTGTIPGFLDSRSLLLANARSGISVLIDLLSPCQIWLPSYLCASMLQSTVGKRIKVRFYEVNFDLAVKSVDWLNDVQPGDLVVVIDYFGFECPGDCVKKVKEQGAWVLEDACQALLSNDVGRFADFVLFSPRKFVGVPDGGILHFKHPLETDRIHLKPPPADWWLKTFYASVMRREFDNYGENRKWFELFQETNDESPVGHYAMSELSRMLLQNSFDYVPIARRRIENYQYLTDRLGDLAIFPVLPTQTVPLGFPIRINERDRVRHALFEHQIYPPLHWPVPEIVPTSFKDSYTLGGEIMTLPCDQRYSLEDMERMAHVLLEILSC